MDVLVVRHGIALSREEASSQGMLDRDRPLTDRGRSRMKRSARALSRLCPDATLVTTSPFRRALETAEILRKEYDRPEMTETSALLPDGRPAELAAFLAESAAGSPVAVVGHEPQLGTFVAWCLGGTWADTDGSSDAPRVIELRKGGACLLAFDDAPGPGKGRLVWLLPPATLRAL